MKQCPNCRNEAIAPLMLYGIELDFCDCCNGMWFDSTELATLLESRPSLTGFPTVDDTHVAQDLICPDCKIILIRVDYGYSSGIGINKCRSCRGTWLRSGQLQHLFSFSHAASASTIGERLLIPSIESNGRNDRWSRWIGSRTLSGVAAATIILCEKLFRDDGKNLSTAFGVMGMLLIWGCDAMQMLIVNSRFQMWGRRLRPSPPITIAMLGWILITWAFVFLLIRQGR